MTLKNSVRYAGVTPVHADSRSTGAPNLLPPQPILQHPQPKVVPFLPTLACKSCFILFLVSGTMVLACILFSCIGYSLSAGEIVQL